MSLSHTQEYIEVPEDALFDVDDDIMLYDIPLDFESHKDNFLNIREKK